MLTSRRISPQHLIGLAAIVLTSAACGPIYMVDPGHHPNYHATPRQAPPAARRHVCAGDACPPSLPAPSTRVEPSQTSTPTADGCGTPARVGSGTRSRQRAGATSWATGTTPPTGGPGSARRPGALRPTITAAGSGAPPTERGCGSPAISGPQRGSPGGPGVATSAGVPWAPTATPRRRAITGPTCVTDSSTVAACLGLWFAAEPRAGSTIRRW